LDTPAAAKVWKPEAALPSVTVPVPVLAVVIFALLKSFATTSYPYVSVRIPFVPISIVNVSPSFRVNDVP